MTDVPGGADGAAAPVARQAGGSIYDLGYRGYDGPRLGRWHGIRAVFLHTLKVFYGVGRGGRAKLAPIILGGFATLPVVVTIGVLALARQAGAGEMAEQASPIQHGTYYGIVTILVILFCAAQAPETLGRDQRFNLLSLYFSRAIRRSDYALARLAGIVVAVLLFVLLPQVVMVIGFVLGADDVAGELVAELGYFPPILLQGLILAAVLGAVSGLVSAMTPRRAYATVAIVLLAVTPAITAILVEIGTTAVATWLALLSPVDVTDATNAWLFDTSPSSDAVLRSDLPLPVYAVAAALLVGGCGALVVRRFDRVAA